MRLWHKDLIPLLPRRQLLGQWRECCLIAKQIDTKGTPNHVLVNRILDFNVWHFWKYSHMVLVEMQNRGYKCDASKFIAHYHGDGPAMFMIPDEVFPNWHNNRYLNQCLANLQEKYDCGAIPEDEWKKITAVYPRWR